MAALNKIELINFLHSCGILDVTEALRLKAMNSSDWAILAHYKISKKTYQRWANEYHSNIGKSVMIRKRGRLVSMVCGECGGIIRFDYRGERVCDKCGLIVEKAEQMAERIRFALRELGKPAKSQSDLKRIKNLLTVGKSEKEVIRIMASK